MTQTILKTPNRFWLSAPKENKTKSFEPFAGGTEIISMQF